MAAGLDFWSMRTGKQITQDDVEPLTWALAEQGWAHSAAQLRDARSATPRSCRARRLAWWQDYDLLLTPTLAQPPAELGTIGTGARGGPARRRSCARSPTRCSRPAFNATGQPAISLPLHWSEDGLPIGVQLVGDMGREDLLLRVAAQLEEAAPWAERRPPAFAAA